MADQWAVWMAYLRVDYLERMRADMKDDQTAEMTVAMMDSRKAGTKAVMLVEMMDAMTVA